VIGQLSKEQLNILMVSTGLMASISHYFASADIPTAKLGVVCLTYENDKSYNLSANDRLWPRLYPVEWMEGSHWILVCWMQYRIMT
jgi:hypothetical protein